MEMVSKKGGRKMAHQGFIYNFDKYSVDLEHIYWRCEQKDRCKGRLHITKDGTVVQTINAHTYDTDPAKIQARQAVSEIKSRAAETLEGTSEVINASLRNLPECVMGVMPSNKQMVQGCSCSSHQSHRAGYTAGLPDLRD